ncbi:MAG TPA: Holliday junction resolvase RuvX, partial [Candidatus Eisenbacteria bacterium]|nr:Holliday junction resolvase RuvX [Candidatus Eisenbacteria bacterium]
GLALSDPGEVLATPFRSIRIDSVREAPGRIATAARESGAEAIVVGAPLGLEGEEARPEMRRVERLATALRRETGLPVHLVDESLSTREAEARVPASRRTRSGDAQHAAAAAVILQRWLDRPRKRQDRAKPAPENRP